MLLTYLTFFVALCLSAIGAFYSIVGLTAIFAAAVVPIIVMGSILEISKLVVTVWLHEYWQRCRFIMKCYLVPAVGVLMIITSMGIFGFLSKAHLDQTVPADDISSQVTLYDDKIKTERDNIATARAALSQMDAQVNAKLDRTKDDSGAERAVQIRRQQAKERAALQRDISDAQKRIVQLQEKRAPIASQVRRIEAEVGPIRYIAALIYGDNPDANLLERAVRWVIIILVAVFDPLAIMMLLAATESLKWEREKKKLKVLENNHAEFPEPTQPPSPVLDQTDSGISLGSTPAVESTEATYPPALVINLEFDDDINQEDDSRVKQAKFYWKQDNPDQTLKEQRRRLADGEISELPWLSYIDDPRVISHVSFGATLPAQGTRGEMFVHTGYLPTKIYKFTGDKWIEIDKNVSDNYAYNQNYIDYLISKISSGEYDPELLTTAERSQIEVKLKQEV